MKTEFTAAITQLSAERNLPKGVILAALESALASAYKKEASSPDQDITVKIDPNAGKVKAYTRKVVVESVTDPNIELSINEVRNLRDTVQVGETIGVEFVPKNTGRITAQMVKQLILQRLREAEHHAIYGEFAGREGELIAGVVQFIEPKQIYVRLNRTEAILPLNEQIQNEHYQKGLRLKFYLLEIARDVKGPQIIVSRSHPNLVRRLFELEIPEIHSGVVELKAIAREAGHRTKVAVSTRQEGIEPVGCCLGPRSIRLQSIINELNGEKIDVIQWHADPEIFIANALSPAQVASIKINEAEKVATVVVPDKQLSLAIGREGQNARLAARLTNWRIDIKSVSAIEAVRAQEKTEKAIPQELETVAAESVLIEPAALEPASDILLTEVTELPAIPEVPPEKPEKKCRFILLRIFYPVRQR
jgi:transcription termination factor NusA